MGWTDLLKKGVEGVARHNYPGMMQQYDQKGRDKLDKKHIESLIQSREFQDVIRQAQAVALKQQNETRGKLTAEERKQKLLNPYGYGRGTVVDPLVKGAEDIGKIRKAQSQFEDKVPPETAAYFDAAEQSVKDRTGWKDPKINVKTDKPRRIFDKSGDVVGTRNKDDSIKYDKNLKGADYFELYDRHTGKPTQRQEGDNRGLFSEGKSPFEIEDYYQAATETVPVANEPKTFQQLGITSPADQQVFQEMQKAVPDVDLRQEMEQDPEGMKRLIKLWQERKLNKKNIRNAFSAIQQRAKQSLGIA